MTPTPASSLLGRNAAVAGLYAGVGLIALTLGQLSGLASPVWPSAGIAFALVFVWGWRVLPGVALGSFTVNAITLGLVPETFTVLWTTALAIAVGAALEAIVGSALVRRFVGPRLTLDTPRGIVMPLLLAGPVACVIAPTIGVAAQLANGILTTDQALIGWATWWAGDTVGVMIFAPLTLMFVPSQKDLWDGRRWKVAVPSLLIIAGLSLAFVQNSALEQENHRQQLDQLGVEARADLLGSLGRHEEVLQSVSGLQAASQEVTSDEFRAFTLPVLERFPNLQALSWNPVVTADEREAFEQSQRAQGFEDYSIRERDANGDLQPASPRADYVPIGYIEPLGKNLPALGFDIQSNPIRAKAITTARDSGRISATAPIDLVQDSGTQKGMLALKPVFAGGDDPGSPEARRAVLDGFAVGVYRLGDLIRETYAGGTWDRTNIQLLDITDGTPVELASIPAREPATVDVVSGGVEAVTFPVDVYGRTWEVRVTPTSGPLAEPTPESTTGLLGIGVLVVFLLQAFVLLLTGLEHRARREAEDSTYEANHDSLTGLLSRRAFVRQFASVVESQREVPSTDVLLFCDLDGFKLVNDRAGHEAGDRMLVQVAEAMRRTVRSRDIVARMGGDEFAIILVDCPPERGLAIADSVLEAVEGSVVHTRAGDLSVGVSIGGTVIDPASPVDVDEAMRRADAACYVAKRGGRGHVRMFEEDMAAPAPHARGPR